MKYYKGEDFHYTTGHSTTVTVNQQEMGATWSHLPGQRKSFTVIMVGLDNTGKTSIVNRLKNRTSKALLPTTSTIGSAIETVSFPFAEIRLWEMGGSEKVRPMWMEHYWNADAFAFVVSATDTAGLSEARTELHKISKAREIGNSALVVLVNKSDLVDYHDYYGEGEKGEKGSSKQSKDGGKDVIKSVTTALDVGRVGFRVWTVKAVSALTGEGLDEAFKWLANNTSNAQIWKNDWDRKSVPQQW